MTDEDVAVAREADGDPVEVELDGVSYDVCLVESDQYAYQQFYNVIANPILWFVQHYLWDLSNAPDIRARRPTPGSGATPWSTRTSPRRCSTPSPTTPTRS